MLAASGEAAGRPRPPSVRVSLDGQDPPPRARALRRLEDHLVPGLVPQTEDRLGDLVFPGPPDPNRHAPIISPAGRRSDRARATSRRTLRAASGSRPDCPRGEGGADRSGGRRPRGRHHQPGQGVLSRRDTRSSTWRSTTLRSPKGALRGIAGRPIVLKRYVNGAEGEPFFRSARRRRIPSGSRRWSCAFPSGRTAREIVVRDAAQLLWIVNLGCIDLNPHPVRADDLEHPDELRMDLDPGPGVGWDDVRRVALVVRGVLEEHGLRGWPKTSGSRGMHVNVRIERRWGFDQVRRAALAIAREVERRAPDLATSKWWKEERHGVFLDYNQNAKDRTVASAWSVRPDARRARFDAARMGRGRRLRSGGFHARHRAGALGRARRRVGGIDAAAGSLEGLLELVRGAGGRGPGRRAVAAALQEAVRRAAARRAVAARRAPAAEGTRGGRRQSTQPLVTVANAKQKEDALAGLERWKARHPEAAALLQVDDVLVDSMRGRSSTWTRIRVNLRHVPEERRPAEEPPDPDYDPCERVAVRPARAARAEDALELVRRRDLQLVVAAILRPLVGAPAHEVRGVPEARALHVVVGDLADALGPQRLPAQILAAIPAARGPRQALPLRGRLAPAPAPSRATDGLRARSRAAARAPRRAARASRW